MLKHLQKFFAGNTAQPASAETQEGTMTQNDEQTIMAAEPNTAELTAQIATMSASLADAQKQLAEMAAAYGQVQAALANSEAAQAALQADAKAATTAKRKATLEATLGSKNPKVAEVLASLENVDEATFAIVTGAMAASFDSEANSEMFTETGAAPEAVAAVEVDAVQRLAANIAKEFKTQ